MEIEMVKMKIREIITNDLDSNIEIESIKDDVSLYDDGLGLDSIAIVNLIVCLEKKFDFKFDEDEINAKLFASINNLALFIHPKTHNLAPDVQNN